MSDEIPKVKTRAVRRRDGIWDLYITGPFCGKQHHHGGGDGDSPNLGYRAPHCTGSASILQEYELVPGD